jgi:ABC-type nitrate/sulfonate/bicarbonate transport system substrate-binding protein
MKKSKLFVLSLCMSLMLAGCGSGKAATSDDANGEEGVIRYQVYRSHVNPIDLAIDLGYLDGIRMEGVSDYKGGTESIQLVGTGVVDLGWSFNGALVKAHAKHVELVSVVSNYGSDDVTNISAFVLEDSDIREARDLIGKKVGVNILGAHMEFVIREYMMQAGLTKKETDAVQLVTVPATSAEQALRAGQLDVVLLMGAAKDLALDRGGLRELFTDVDVIGRHFTAGNYFFSKKFVESKPDTVRKFVEAIAKTIEWSKTTPREDVIARMERIIQERNPFETTENLRYWKSFGIAGEGGVISDEEMQIWIDWLVANGELKEGEVNPRDLYTNEFNPYAK